ncbi:transglutaminase domain-containing protein [Candidatus Eisenbacteria bacterium]|uniref:Transglutaminase domain-containing protein n=1 Tax=Eiseniibacteriota bacterium TaxID=2212470 RepID=A0ABV6YJ33_UNCEI
MKDVRGSTKSEPQECELAEADSLYTAYRRLIERAAALGILSISGETPREHCRLLIESGYVGATDAERLRQLVESSRYKASGDHAMDAITLCHRLASGFPEPVRPETKPKRPAGVRRITARLGRITPIALALSGLVAVALFVGRADFGCAPGTSIRPVTRVPGTSRGAVPVRTAPPASSSWNRPSNHAKYNRMSPPKVLSKNRAGTVSLDTQTGVDGYIRRGVDRFHPSIGWTYRLQVYTTVDPDFAMVASGAPYRELSMAEIDTTSYRIAQHATVKVHLLRGIPTPIPSPSPDAIVSSYVCTPPASLNFLKDSGDALCVVADRTGVVKIDYDLLTVGDYRSGPITNVPFTPRPQVLPDNVRAASERVIEAIGGLPAPGFNQTLWRLRSYFSGFAVAPLTEDDQQENEFLTVALARKGVCRHRARSFFVVANALGIPTRLVENEVHSFVEVLLPNDRWRRVELRLAGEGPVYVFTSVDGVLAVSWVVLLILLILLFSGILGAPTANRLSDEPDRRRWFRRAVRDDNGLGRERIWVRFQQALRARVIQTEGRLEVIGGRTGPGTGHFPVNIFGERPQLAGVQRESPLRGKERLMKLLTVGTEEILDSTEMGRRYWEIRFLFRQFKLGGREQK